MRLRSELLALVVGAAILLAALAPPLPAQALPPPSIFSLSPPSAFAGSADLTLTVFGTGFVDNGAGFPQLRSVVLWNGQALSTSYTSSAILTAAVPASLLTTVNTAIVQVWNPTAGQLSNNVRFDILTPLSITTTALAAGTVGGNYTQQLLGVGGTQPYIGWFWSPATQGSLPPGLSLDELTGVISGIPSVAGSYSILVSLYDANERLATKTFSLVINPPPSVSTTSLPNAQVGVAYSQPITVTGGTGPYTWSVSEGLPAGLTLSQAGVLIGTPGAMGTYTFTVTVTDAALVSAQRLLSLTVNPAALTITTTSLPGGTAGSSYSQTIVATGGIAPYTWSSSGTLPPGLTLSAAGILSGIPTQAGTFNFTVRVDASGSFTTRTFSLAVNPAQLTIPTNSPLPSATAGSAYTQTFAVTGGISPYTWTLASGALPSGLALAAGVLSGTPTQGGTFPFTVGVADNSGGSTSKAFSLTVTVPPAPALSVTGLTDTATPAQQPSFDVQVSATYSLPITGTARLTFAPNAVNAADDPAIQFSGGGRTLNFSIPAGQLNASWPSSHAIGTGTVAGQINLTLENITAGGQSIPSPPARVVTIARAAPAINAVQVVRVTGGFNVVVTGFSTPRQVTQAAFTFTPASGANLQTAQVTVPVDSTFTTWYTGTSSPQFGSAFLYTQPFTVQGNVSDIASVSVTLSNATGTSTAVSASF